MAKENTALNFPYPWFGEYWQRLIHQAQYESSKSNALLFISGKWIGVAQLLRLWVQTQLCETVEPPNLACGKCHSCRLFSGHSHSDYMEVSSSQSNSVIGIDAVREIHKFVATTPLIAQSRIVFIEQAEKMTLNASNALLKVLEEPPPSTIFIMNTSHVRQVLPTVRSRCRKIFFPHPNLRDVDQWYKNQQVDDPVALNIFGKTPLLLESEIDKDFWSQRQRWCQNILSLKYNARQLSQEIQKTGFYTGLLSIMALLRDLIRVKCGADLLENVDFSKQIEEIGPQANLDVLYACMDGLQFLMQVMESGVNQALQLEYIFCLLRSAFRNEFPLSNSGVNLCH